MPPDGQPMGQMSQRTTWRIAHIPAAFESKVQMNPFGLLGAILFFGCLLRAMIIKTGDAVRLRWVAGAVFGLGVGLLAGWYRARRERRSWVKVKAQCLDREWHLIRIKSGRTTWVFRILCTFDFEGKQYRATPIYWTTFFSEGALMRFLEKAIAPDGTCELYVNPRDPLQVELVGRDLKDLLVN